ncbi:VWA domain-containing protein [Bosea caraganae]|uniref:VWA domain-containing protein n=1 Tax=Bosea caraganae TaxID=2763117 RepID=A0A370L5N1_9HYPH|nr:VWA domain-containing protein [Bosea caraganae]RDJ23349.1 VWA domain-containing protein [Bosea caraganae]RDJ24539.1 VWA domain-containing protein [Bosea caraganae]
MIAPLPAAARPFVAFPSLLREHGIAVAPEQTTSFLMAVELLGPRSMEHVRKAAAATLSPHPEQRERFDALFDMHFLGALAEPGEDDWQPDEDMSVQEDSGSREVLIGEGVNETGQAATGAEALSIRGLRTLDESETLRRFGRALPAALPRRRGYRHRGARRGPMVDLARSLKAAIRHDGEVMDLKKLRRVTRPRPILLLIDVSGSMKQRSDANLALAHAVVQAAPRVEVFTFGTRLSRVTRALRRRRREQALAEASGLVADWDGGTRIGDALGAFLAVPRFASYARGAVVIVLSDGLERGEPAALVNAVTRLAARAHRIDWLTPLAADPGYRPETEALRLVAPMLDSLTDGGSTARICRHILSLGGTEAA